MSGRNELAQHAGRVTALCQGEIKLQSIAVPGVLQLLDLQAQCAPFLLQALRHGLEVLQMFREPN